MDLIGLSLADLQFMREWRELGVFEGVYAFVYFVMLIGSGIYVLRLIYA